MIESPFLLISSYLFLSLSVSFSSAIPEERGSYGFWTVCSNVHSINLGISWNCDPISSLFRPPPLMSTAGILAIIHIVLIALFFPISILRVLQVLKDHSSLLLSPQTIGIIKVSLAILSAIFAALVLVLTSVREEAAEQTIIYQMAAYKHYTISKSWAFWIEVTVLSIEIPLVIFCAIENTQLMKVDALIKLSDIASMQASLPRTSPYQRTSAYQKTSPYQRTSPYFQTPSLLGQQSDIHSARPAHVIQHARTGMPRSSAQEPVYTSHSHHHSRPQTSSSQNTSSSICTSCPVHCSAHNHHQRTMNGGHRSEQNLHNNQTALHPRPFSPTTPYTSSILNTHFKSFADDDEGKKFTSGNCYHSNSRIRESVESKECIEVTRRDRNSLSSSKHVKISTSAHSQSPSSSPDHSPTNTFLNSVFEDLPILSRNSFHHTSSAQNQRPIIERY